MKLKKILKSKLPITAIFERLCIEKKVRQIFSVFTTCSFHILMCEIDPGCKQMLFLEHAQYAQKNGFYDFPFVFVQSDLLSNNLTDRSE